MNRFARSLALAVGLCTTGAAAQAEPTSAPARSAERGSASLAAPQQREQRPSRARPSLEETPEPAGRGVFAREPVWRGPRVKLSYRLIDLRDDLGGRLAHTAGIAGFLPTRWVRAGVGVEAGARDHTLASSEGFISGSLFVGYQLLRHAEPAVPYVVALGEYGVMLGKHFHTPVSRAIRGAGVELGCDLRWVRGLSTGVGAVFMMYTMEGLAYPSWGLRASVGL